MVVRNTEQRRHLLPAEDAVLHTIRTGGSERSCDRRFNQVLELFACELENEEDYPKSELAECQLESRSSGPPSQFEKPIRIKLTIQKHFTV